LVVVFVPSLCWVVELVLACPFGFDAEVVLVCFDGSLVFVVLLFCPSGFSVVVVLEVLWAKPAPLNARLSPIAIAATLDVGLMVFLRYIWRRSPLGGTSRMLVSSTMAGQRSRPSATNASDERSCTGAQTSRATDGGAAASPDQSTCHCASSWGPATSSKTKGKSHHDHDVIFLGATQIFLLFLLFRSSASHRSCRTGVDWLIGA
jgi:hypothetical protein